jgi:hypothetical protein
MSLTPGAGDYIVWFTATVWNQNFNKVVSVSLYVGGVQVTHTIRDIYKAETTVAFQAYITGVGASDAIEVYWYVTGGIGTMERRSLTALAC